MNSLAQWSYITSYDIRYYTGKDAGSGYDLGAQDGTWEGLIPLIPAAINVTLFRPYPWEVRNPLMLLSSIESLLLLILTIMMVIKMLAGNIRMNILDRIIISFLVFSISFAFAVGVSTYNFGSLSRYKIPVIPLYFSCLILMNSKSNNSKVI